MWDDDQDVRAALLAELAAGPPQATAPGLTEVMGRGRRRRRMRQVGVAAAAVALLGATTATAAALGGGDDGVPVGQPPLTTSTPTADAEWPRADLPPHQPYTTWQPGEIAPPPHGREIVHIPLCDMRAEVFVDTDNSPAPPELQSRLMTALKQVAPNTRLGELVNRHLVSHREGARDAYTASVDATDDGGTGSVTLGVGVFTGTPVAAADAQAFDLRNCDPPKRHVLSDGTVLQVYPLEPGDPFQSLSRTLRVFLPNGTLYQLVVANWGSPDFTPNPDQPDIPTRTGAGRADPPLTEAQLADLGLAMTG